MMKIPPYLMKGDTVGLTCPAGFMSRDKVESCVKQLEDAGYHVVIGSTVGGSSATYFSGTDEERRLDFQTMLDDKNIKAILCARGGYGTGRIIDKINFNRFKKHPKWIIGFSDITVIHSHLYTKYKISSLHAPMASAFNHGETGSFYTSSLLTALTGEKLHYECSPHVFNRRGEAAGQLVGGNLTMLAHLMGSPSDVKTKGCILFLEDVGEYLYNIDRMLFQLKRSGKLDKLAGVIIGGFTDSKDTERPFGKTVYEIIRETFNGYDYPICFNFPVSHDIENVALKIGVRYRLKVGKNKVTLEEWS